MLIIKSIAIKDFRSISFANLNITSGFLPVVGANNSGKSNILRALNLFFNNEVEPGRILNFSEDFHNPSRRKKKEIVISIDFDLPASFKFQKTIRTGLEELLGRQFQIKKTWSMPEYPIERDAKLKIFYKKNTGELKEASQDEEYRIRQFLALIRFRYVPNHIHPSEILRSEQSSIQIELLAKLRRSKKVPIEQQESLFKELGKLSREFILPISKELHSAALHIETVDLSTPKDMGELLFSFAPRLKVSGGEIFNALLHGSGVQSLLTLLILRYLDSRFSSRFGWHQATIWAIEEPESFLHKDLEYKVADVLSETGGQDSRFQVFCTTHSDVFVRHAIKGILCVLKNGKTEAQIRESRELCGEAAQLGISSYVPPIIYGAPKPLLIVEGPSDKLLIEYSYASLKITCPWEIQDIQTITGGFFEGVDGFKTYLKGNQEIIKSRSLKSPIFILIDWNESDKQIGEYQNLLKIHPTSNVCRWIKDESNLELDNSFAGIEKYLSTNVILEASKIGLLNVKRPAHSEFPFSVERNSIKKKELAKFVVKRNSRDDIALFLSRLQKLNENLVESQQKAMRIEKGILF